MGMYQAIRELWKQPKENLGPLYKQRLITWRKEDVITSIKRPTRLDRARSLGYKAKRGITIIRVRVSRGGRKREARKHGRRSRTMRRKKIVGMSYQWIAEQKAQRSYKNLEVLNSYWVGKDGLHYWYEVIMIDPYMPEIKADKNLKWICYRKHTNRVFRGKTSAGQKSRGMLHTGKGREKIRPGRRANKRLSK
ncbi:MAG: large subunit ribosomal protein L15e [archaeon GW2011_AR17]|nr:MAG: large subunit ribosomal protein L15e [archaeon GW2011_AR17]MBS3154450.1 50S ribosomal protein L15e [Candidatus Woesearchaeota archaeon]HIH15696.1 50S ribosomal protein L15e [Nanoarchaeota archaeon]HIH59351.1 50S ribosomal protein L15e [Nanoarchaeota archaeon]HII13571.1 50S ribosomal protein L15e [Nanoarchaeota archaeon]